MLNKKENDMAKSNKPTPVNGPSKTGGKSGGRRGNNPPRSK